MNTTTSNLETVTPSNGKTKTSVILDHHEIRISGDKCKICQSGSTASDTPNVCSQGHRFCKDCLQIYLKTKINEFKGDSITCPQDSCSQKFDESLIKTLLDAESFKLYEQRKLEKTVVHSPNNRFCPKPGCSRVYKISKNKPYSTCKCSSLICNDCGEFWHPGKTCEQAEDKDLKAFIQANTIRYCVMCKTLTERHPDSKCMYMTCPVCDYLWCWQCGKDYMYVGSHSEKCEKQWNPEPPEFILNEPEHYWTSQRIKNILIWILLLPAKFLFILFFACNNKRVFKDKMIDTPQKVEVIFVCSLISLGYSGGTICLTLLAFTKVFGGESTPGLTYLVVLLYLIFVIYLIGSEVMKYRKSRPAKRYMRRNPKEFKIIRPRQPSPRQPNYRLPEPIRNYGDRRPLPPSGFDVVENFINNMPHISKKRENEAVNTKTLNVPTPSGNAGNIGKVTTGNTNQNKDLNEIKVVS